MTVREYVAANAERFIDELKQCCRFASVSTLKDPALADARDWLAAQLKARGGRVEVWPTPGDAAVFASFDGRADRRLLLYSHYDVQPIGSVDEWDSPPFAAEIRGGRIVSRGVCDDKADVMARIHAIEVWAAMNGDLPFSLAYLCEGEEEVGSPNFPGLIHRHRTSLEADGCLWESAGFDEEGRASLFAGCRGILYVELRMRCLSGDEHSEYASIYPNAASALVEAIASLRNRDGRVAVRGFYDDVLAPTSADLKLIDRAGVSDQRWLQRLGAREFNGRVTGSAVVRNLLFEPTANISGLYAGHSGPGARAIIPAEAGAKMDFRLVPEQDPDDALRKIRRHFDELGFQDLEIVPLAKIAPARSALASDVVAAATSAADEAYGSSVLLPFKAAAGPVATITNDLGVPTVIPVGCQRPDARVHAANENIVVADYLNCIAYNVTVFDHLAGMWDAARERTC